MSDAALKEAILGELRRCRRDMDDLSDALLHLSLTDAIWEAIPEGDVPKLRYRHAQTAATAVMRVLADDKPRAIRAYPVQWCSSCGGSRPFSEGRCLACGSAE